MHFCVEMEQLFFCCTEDTRMIKPIALMLPSILEASIDNLATASFAEGWIRFAQNKSPLAVDEAYVRSRPLQDVSKLPSMPVSLLWKELKVTFNSSSGQIAVLFAGDDVRSTDSVALSFDEKQQCAGADSRDRDSFIAGKVHSSRSKIRSNSENKLPSNSFAKQMKHDLLTREQEVALANRFIKGFASIQSVICEIAEKTQDADFVSSAEYINHCRRHNMPIRYDSIKLDAAVKKLRTREFRGFVTKDILDGEIALNTLMQMNFRLVYSEACKQLRFCKRELEDLIQEGCIGLMKGIVRFDPSRGNRLATYATSWIIQSIRRSEDAAIRVPAYRKEAIGKINQCYYYLVDKLGRQPTQHEIAHELNMTIEQLSEMQLINMAPESLSTPLGQDEDSGCLLDVLENITAENPEVMTIQGDLKDFVLVFLRDRLTPKEFDVLVARYGLNGEEPSALEDIGKRHHLTRERIRQIEIKAIRKIKKLMTKLAMRNQY